MIWKALRLYIDARGRATVYEFWVFMLAQYAVLGALTWISVSMMRVEEPLSLLGLSLTFLVGGALLPPTLTLALRRFHDIGWSANVFVMAIVLPLGGVVVFRPMPAVVWIVLHGLALIPSQRTDNAFGPYHKNAARFTNDEIKANE